MREAEKPGLLNRPAPGWLVYGVAVAIVGIAVFLASNWGVMHVYRRYFFQTLPEVQVRWDGLARTMDEAAVRAHFAGLTLICQNEDTPLGERACYVPVSKADGYPALTLAMAFRSGRLNVVMVHVPSWAHDRAQDALKRQYGPGRPVGKSASGQDLSRWVVRHGYLDINTKASGKLMEWSAVVWSSRAETPSP